MKKLVAMLLALIAVLSLTACGGTSPAETTAPPAVDLTAQEVLDSLREVLGESYGCSKPETEAMTMGYYGLDARQIESWVHEVHEVSSANMDQALILKVKDGYAQQAADALQEGFNQKAGYAQMYNMDLARIGEARLFVTGNYVALLVLGQKTDADPEEQAKLAAAEGEKIDAAWEQLFGVHPENQITIPEPQQESEGGMGGARPGVRPRG